MTNFRKTNREIVEGFRAFAADKTSRLSIDNAWPTRLVLHHLQLYRARLLYERRFARRPKFNSFDEQTIPCVQMKKIDLNECPCAPATGCYFAKSIHPIPRPIGGKLTSVVAVSADHKFDFIPWHTFKDTLNSRIPAERTARYYTFKNIESSDKVHLYIYNKSDLELLSITGTFEDPLEVAAFPKCGEESAIVCSPLDEVFVLEKDLIPVLYDMAFEKLISVKGAVGSDILTNSQDDSAAPQTPLK